MGTLKPNKSIIYESPDGGETVYGRYSGETERFLVGESLKAQEHRQGITDNQMWQDIRQEAKTNPALQKAIDRVIMIYRLSKDNPK